MVEGDKSAEAIGPLDTTCATSVCWTTYLYTQNMNSINFMPKICSINETIPKPSRPEARPGNTQCKSYGYLT